MLINYGKLIPWESQYCVKIKTKRIMTFIQEYNYQDIINKQPIYHLCKKNDRYFYEMFIFK